jgi:heme A synthase
MVSIAFFTSKSWVEKPALVVRMDARPQLTTIAMLTVAAVWLQLVMGAAFRHSGIRLLPHIVGATLVFCMVSWLTITTLRRHRATVQLARPAAFLLALLMLQITLGLASYITRVLWSQGASSPLASMVVATVAHVACGALVLVTSVILTVQIHRHLDLSSAPDVVRRSGDASATQGPVRA